MSLADTEPAPDAGSPILEGSPPAARPLPAAPARGPIPSVDSIVRSALDALQSAGRDLRILSAAVVLFSVAAVGIPASGLLLYAGVLGSRGTALEDAPAGFALLMLVAALVALVAAALLLVQVPLLIVATVGGRLAGTPLTLREALRRSRQVFLRGFGATIVMGLATRIPATIAQGIIEGVFGQTQLAAGLSIVGDALFGSPWVYVIPGIVLGGVGVTEALRRSWQVARFRWRIALTIALLGAIGQFIVLAAALGMLGALDALTTVTGAPAVPVGAEIVVALLFLFVLSLVAGSVLFGLQLVQFAPQASGFYALTEYASALEAARVGPPEPLFHRAALLFYGLGIIAGLLLLAEALPQLPS